MHWLLLLTLLASPRAWALSQPMTGAALDITAGGGVTGVPASGAGTWQVSAGVWKGRYDKDFAIGRAWAFSTCFRQGVYAGGLVHSALFDVRRRLDLLVLTPQAGVLVGPTLLPGGKAGVTAELGLGANWRLHRFYGLAARLEGGATLGAGPPAPTVGLRVGFTWARPFAKMDAIK